MDNVQWIMSHRWAILPEMLQTIINIASRETGLTTEQRQAIAAKDGDPLQGARRAQMRNGVAVIPVTGPIFPRANLFTMISGGTSVDMLAKDFQAAIDNPDISAIVLNMDSPGGEITGISEFANMVFQARDKKTVLAYIYGLGASAGYWIASAASQIVVADTAIVGCIGVVATYQDTRAKDEKAGIKNIEFVSSVSPNKRPDPATDAGRAVIQKEVDDLASVFVGAVAKYRGVPVETVAKDFGAGGVFVGNLAVKAGLANAMGDFEAIVSKYEKKPNQKGGLFMDLAELKAEHPDLYKAVVEEGRVLGLAEGKKSGTEEGAAAERARIQGIESISIPGAEAVIAEGKFVPGMTKEAVAVKILEDQKARAAAIGKKHQDDATALAAVAVGIGNAPAEPVKPQTADEKKKADDAAQDALVKAAVEKVNATRR